MPTEDTQTIACSADCAGLWPTSRTRHSATGSKVVRLAKQIASQQLPRVGCALNPLYNAREHAALVVDFVGAARVCEMRPGASVREEYETKNEYGPKRNDDNPGGSSN